MKLNSKILLFSFLFIITATAIIITFEKFSNEKICINEKCYEVKIADSEDERSLGLMYRERLNYNEGMLFIFEMEDLYSFWMKNTLIPLDLIWIDSDFNIVYIKENFLPCQVSQCEIVKPDKPSLYVLEINAGQILENNIKINDKVYFK